MLSMPNRPSQQLLGTDFSIELTSQKQSADELCEVLSMAAQLLWINFELAGEVSIEEMTEFAEGIAEFPGLR